MISSNFILLPYWYGRFGNRMHEYAYVATYSAVNNVDAYIPSRWEGSRLFKNQPCKIVDDDTVKDFISVHRVMTDQNLDRDMKDFFDKSFSIDIKRINPTEDGMRHIDNHVFVSDHCSYSNKIFEKMSKDHLLELFEFSDEVKNLDSYKFWESRKGEYDIAHLRRGDISSKRYNTNKIIKQCYSVISKHSYYSAFEKYGFDKKSIEWVSDDISKKWDNRDKKISIFGSAYPEGSLYKKGFIFDWLDDFLSLYFARTIFRANSSFSWWAAFLSPTAKVYSPVLTKRHIYGVDGDDEVLEDFVEGNHPHWMKGICDIIIPE